MRRSLALASMVLMVIGLAAGHAEPRAHRQKIAALPHFSSFALAGDLAKEPIGWGQLCATHPEDCDVGKLEPASLPLSKENWATLNRINSLVNDTIEQVSDLEHYGMIEWWAYPDDGKGDCEDLQLLKRRMLMQTGMPRQSLMMTVVRDNHDEGHAVLLVRTDHGDFVLDSRTSAIKPWRNTGYKFIKRQSQEDPNIWVFFGDESDSLITSSAPN